VVTVIPPPLRGKRYTHKVDLKRTDVPDRVHPRFCRTESRERVPFSAGQQPIASRNRFRKEILDITSGASEAFDSSFRSSSTGILWNGLCLHPSLDLADLGES